MRPQSPPRPPSGAAAGHCSPRHAGVREVVAARRATDLARIAATITRGITSGELAEDTDVDAVTAMIHGFLLGISTQVCDGIPAQRLHAAADALLAYWDAPRRNTPGLRPA
ncbi:TetR family transcriptional regulator C-terminal domain-containing protein [Streptomyces sp. NPDC102476]|uniref:TetR family transcriptional regulator C-terminal domain-containing protein n=1 Tax=Streptomyces sp. NPDC102476 TaxID=3366181 RepID=UPI00381B5BF2